MREEERVDRISQLPHSIRVLILSFLPTKEVVKMILVPPFRDVWTRSRNLTFDQNEFHDSNSRIPDAPHYNTRFVNFIRNMLRVHVGETIDEFHLIFWLNLIYEEHTTHSHSSYLKVKSMESEITHWIKFAVRKSVKVLNLNLLASRGGRVIKYELPDLVFRCNDLREFMLAGCVIRKPLVTQLNSLRKLSLRDIELSDNIMNSIVEGCSVLEELSFLSCSGVRMLRLANPRVKRLIISIGWFEEKLVKKKLEIICPHVTSLEISGAIPLVDLKNSSSVLDASLRYDTIFFKCAPKKI